QGWPFRTEVYGIPKRGSKARPERAVLDKQSGSRHEGRRNLNQLLVGCGRLSPMLRGHLAPVLRTQHAQDRDLIACLKFGTSQAVFPRLERQNSALHNLESDFAEKLRDIREREHRVQLVFMRLVDERLYHAPAYSVRLGMLMHGKRANLSDG